MEKTVCELFAGVGGFRLGLEKASNEFNTVWFSQWEPGKKKQWAHDCYVQHFGDVLGGEPTDEDIALINKALVPDHNLLVGGFPCQDYSVARPLPGSQGLNGKKGVLWWQIRDMLEAKRAPFVLLENVDRLLKSPASQRGRDFGVILACFAALDYSVEWRVVNAAEYGGAQRRRRTFIFAYKNDTEYAQRMQGQISENIIQATGFFARTFPIHFGVNVSAAEIEYSDIPGVSESFKFNFENSGYMTNGYVYTAKVLPIEEKSITMRSILEKGVDEKYYLGEKLDKWEYLKGAKKINRVAKNGHEYVFSEGPVAFPDSLDMPSRTMLTSESSLNRSTHVIRDPETGRLRLITPLEAERLQGFGDNWTDGVGMPHKFRYFCMGNALVVPMVTRMGHILSIIMDQEH